MRKLLQIILLKPILWASQKFASRPQRDKIFSALSKLKEEIIADPGKKGCIVSLNQGDKFIVFSDQHRGAKNGADDFWKAEANYLAALDFYFQKGYQFISLGDAEELWENTLAKVKKYNVITFEAERFFIENEKFYKVIGNHDLYWKNDPLAWWQLRKIYGQEVKVYEGIIIEMEGAASPFTIFLTHGHQGDASSDGNWFSKFFVARIWAPLQAYLKINPNTPAYNNQMKTEHNDIMYEWSALQKSAILITGHTHQPVFCSLTHLERLYKQLLLAEQEKDEKTISSIKAEIKIREKEIKAVSVDFLQMRPSYFNSGFCCFSDGDITGIEIDTENISLIKWSKDKERELLEKISFIELQRSLQ